MGAADFAWMLFLSVLRLGLVVLAGSLAFDIRLFAVKTYGMVIHEFDPWFNFRATEYLAEHGREKFFQWFDHQSWYPLGRPVGTTIYPGMQFVAVWIYEALKAYGIDMSLNDVCVMVPAWFGVVATVFLGLMTYEAADSADAAVAAMLIMSILPGHIMRSIAGGFDNECIAISALCGTFFLWCRSIRGPNCWPWGILTGVSYFCMVAAWGGYIFVLNMIGVHTVLLCFLGRYTGSLHRAYSLFFVIGTAMAIQIPVVGLTPLKSLEQMGPMGVFLGLQVLEFCRVYRLRYEMDDLKFAAFRQKVFFFVGAAGVVVAAVLFQIGYFGPISSRVRGLFVQHTRTGNPLVDSVAEHQATSPRAYWQYLHYMCYLAPMGWFLLLLGKKSDASLFVVVFGAVTYYFSSKMNRLVLLLGPVCASLGGIAVSRIMQWAFGQLWEFWKAMEAAAAAEEGTVKSGKKAGNAKKDGKASKGKERRRAGRGEVAAFFCEILEPMAEVYEQSPTLRRCAAVLVLVVLLFSAGGFYDYCYRISESMSEPSIILRGTVRGEQKIIDDYREAYWWLRDNTPEDSRVMAWWDYGYQISGVAKRTTLADGNTWNHEHIATIGRCLTNPEKKAHNIIRHLADYVLIWTGGGSDDLAKSPHMARIANSVYDDVCPGDPTCSAFGFDHQGAPTPMMAESLLYKLSGHNQRPGVRANPSWFQEAYTSEHNLVRIFKVVDVSQESKDWNMNATNRKCDTPGGWHCAGQYPPALRKLIEKRKDFKQLEDFNRGEDKEADEYQKAYHERMEGKRAL